MKVHSKLTTFLLLMSLCVVLLNCGENKQRGDNQVGAKNGINIVNAYGFKFGNTTLFNKTDTFIDEMGLPETFTAFHDTTVINTRTDLDSAIAKAIDKSGMLYLCYPGIIMEHVPDGRVILPVQIDFRKTDNSIKFNETVFDGAFTIEKFRKLFPVSGALPMDSSISLFSMITKEVGDSFKHFIVERESVDVEPGEESGPCIEFTFENGKLIFIYFANF